MFLFVAFCLLGGLWNTSKAVLALIRGHDTLYWQRVERKRDSVAFWFWSIFIRGGSGLMLLSTPFIVSTW